MEECGGQAWLGLHHRRPWRPMGRRRGRWVGRDRRNEGIVVAAVDWSLNARQDLRTRRRHIVTLATPLRTDNATGRIDGSLAAGG